MDCNFAMGYLDDIIIFSKTEEEHLQNLEEKLPKEGRIQAEAAEVQFLQETHSVPWSFDFRRRYTTTIRKTGKHNKNANTTKFKTSKTIFGTCRLLQKVCAMFFRYFETPHTAYPKEQRFQLDYRV